MSILLRHRSTKQFYVRSNNRSARENFTCQREEALDFGTVASAAKVAMCEHLSDVEIVLHYDSCGAEIALPVLREWCLREGWQC